MQRRVSLTLVLQPWAVAYVRLMSYMDGGDLFVKAVAGFVRQHGLEVRQ